MQQMRRGRAGKGDAVARVGLTRTVAVLTLAVVLGMIGFLAAGSIARSTTRANVTVSLHKTKLGLVLANSSGHTLYLFVRDRNGKSACSASCSTFWPPLLHRGAPTAGPGVRASLLGTTRRSNGKLQVTYNRHPLYAFALDKRADETNGEGKLAFGARWYAVSAKGGAVVKASATTTTTAATTTSPYGTTSTPYP